MSAAAEASVRAARERSEVYRFYRDLTNLPTFLGDVMDVERRGPTTYLWTVQGPLGVLLHWDVEVVADEPESLVRYRTGVGAAYGEWTTRFADDGDGGTIVHETIAMPMEAVTTKLLGILGKPPQAEVEANLRRLREVLETGRVTTTAHAVRVNSGPSRESARLAGRSSAAYRAFATTSVSAVSNCFKIE